jgi:hypothetical protein
MAPKHLHNSPFGKVRRQSPAGAGFVSSPLQTAVNARVSGQAGTAGCARTSSPVSHAHGLSCRAVASRSLGAPPFLSVSAASPMGFCAPTPPTLRALALRASASAGRLHPPRPQGAGLHHPAVLVVAAVVRSSSVCHPRHGQRAGEPTGGPRSCSPHHNHRVTMGPQPPYPKRALTRSSKDNKNDSLCIPSCLN